MVMPAMEGEQQQDDENQQPLKTRMTASSRRMRNSTHQRLMKQGTRWSGALEKERWDEERQARRGNTRKIFTQPSMKLNLSKIARYFLITPHRFFVDKPRARQNKRKQCGLRMLLRLRMRQRTSAAILRLLQALLLLITRANSCTRTYYQYCSIMYARGAGRAAAPRGRAGPRGRGGGRGRGRGRGGGGGGGRGPPPQQRWRSSDFSETIEEIGVPPSSSQSGATTISIAVEGCCHGALDPIYERLQQHTQKTGRTVDLCICCGDFQSLRHPADFHSFAVPPKYREMGTFYQYYAGAKVAPILTIFIGGNHEASQSLQELYYGGWVAPNIYYLGAAGVVNYRGIRIGGISGIYKSHDHLQSRFELPPYDSKTMRSVYHYRNLETYRLKCLDTIKRKRLDIMLSHDWPQGIEQHGDTEGLIRRKPFFRQEIAENSLGSPPAYDLLCTLQPSYWFSAHLHVKFQATVKHPSGPAEAAAAEETNNKSRATAEASSPTTMLVPSQAIKTLAEKKSLDDDDNKEPAKMAATSTVSESGNGGEPKVTQFVAPEASSTHPDAQPDLTDLMTQFLSLDKCLPRRQYLSIVNLPVDVNAPAKLQYDIEWLAILRKTHHMFAADRKHRVQVPADVEHRVTDAELAWVRDRLGGADDAAVIPENFAATVPLYVEPADPRQRSLPPPLPHMGNPQTDRLLEHVLGLEHLPNLTIPYRNSGAEPPPAPYPPAAAMQRAGASIKDENEIDLDEDGDGDDDAGKVAAEDDADEINIEEEDGGGASTDDKPPDDKRPRLGQV